MSAKSNIRCAIYTRKSSDEGLDQAFNSLDAQYEACAAYIASQRHEGWKLVTERFDDGGLSGGTLDRPALTSLLSEIDAGRISMVVVYKIDRLTRSLADFVRLVERLEAKGCSFVSVTQAFNTSSSMGRLTLNVLLSFAQFEREVTAERIRDKIAASKQKGLWMGGTVPFGYRRHPDPQRRELMVEPSEAPGVRKLFALYAEHGNLRIVEAKAAERGLLPREGLAQAPTSARAFSRGQLHYLLTNPVYIGRIRHKTKSYPGQHRALISQELWDQVQQGLIAARARPRGQSVTSAPRPLAGKLRDESGDLLTPTHTQRRGRRFFYYVSNRLISGGLDPTGWRLPAPALERTIRHLVADHIRKAVEVHKVCASPDARAVEAIGRSAQILVTRLEAEPDCFAGFVTEGQLGDERLSLQLDVARLADALLIEPKEIAREALVIDAPIALRRRGVETKIVSGNYVPMPDPSLIRILSAAHGWADDLRGGASLSSIAHKHGLSDAYIRTRLPFAFLDPDLQDAILEGRQPPDLTVAKLLRQGIPLDWAEQRRRFG
jgi:site-specific DNA recombinase